MKLYLLILLLAIPIAFAIESGDDSYYCDEGDILKVGPKSTFSPGRWGCVDLASITCMLHGDCILNSLTVYNLSVFSYLQVNATVINYNVTGNIYASGNITAGGKIIANLSSAYSYPESDPYYFSNPQLYIQFDDVAGSFLPTLGGTMNGNIEMSYGAITNIGYLSVMQDVDGGATTLYNTAPSNIDVYLPSESGKILTNNSPFIKNISTSCPLGNYSYGNYINGSPMCRSDVSGGAGSGSQNGSDVSFGKGTFSASYGNSIYIDQNVDAGESTSTGGALRIDNTGNDGAGIVVYSNNGATQNGHLISSRNDNPAFDQSALYATSNGTQHTSIILYNGMADTASALNVVSSNTNYTVVGITGENDKHGMLKLKYQYNYSGNAYDNSEGSALSIDMQSINGVSHAPAIYVDSTIGTTDGDLIVLKRAADSKFKVDTYGNISLEGWLQFENQGYITNMRQMDSKSNSNMFFDLVGTAQLYIRSNTDATILNVNQTDVIIQNKLYALGTVGNRTHRYSWAQLNDTDPNALMNNTDFNMTTGHVTNLNIYQNLTICGISTCTIQYMDETNNQTVIMVVPR